MFIKDTMGNVGEAFSLIMRKEFAYPILKGKKKIEFRQVSDNQKDTYAAIFFKKYKVQDKDDPDFLVPKDVACVHFHDYGNTWFLDCSIEAVDIMAIHPKNADYFHKYGHFEFDEEMTDLALRNVDPHDPEVAWFYCLPITGIINTNLDLTGIPDVQAYCIPDDCIITDPRKLAQAEQQFAAQVKAQKKRK